LLQPSTVVVAVAVVDDDVDFSLVLVDLERCTTHRGFPSRRPDAAGDLKSSRLLFLRGDSATSTSAAQWLCERVVSLGQCGRCRICCGVVLVLLVVVALFLRGHSRLCPTRDDRPRRPVGRRHHGRRVDEFGTTVQGWVRHLGRRVSHGRRVRTSVFMDL
jgi:hypothetical protein